VLTRSAQVGYGVLKPCISNVQACVVTLDCSLIMRSLEALTQIRDVHVPNLNRIAIVDIIP